jgi:hypothetical protein
MTREARIMVPSRRMRAPRAPTKGNRKEADEPRDADRIESRPEDLS